MIGRDRQSLSCVDEINFYVIMIASAYRRNIFCTMAPFRRIVSENQRLAGAESGDNGKKGNREYADRTKNTKKRKGDNVSFLVWKFIFCHIGAGDGDLYEFSGGAFGCGI